MNGPEIKEIIGYMLSEYEKSRTGGQSEEALVISIAIICICIAGIIAKLLILGEEEW